MTLETTRAEIRDTVVGFLSETTGQPALNFGPTTDLAKGGVLDSIQLIQLCFFLEGKYSIALDIEFLATRSTIDDLVTNVLNAVVARSGTGVGA